MAVGWQNPCVIPLPCAAGTLEDFDEAGAAAGASKAETAEEAAARVKLEAAKARESVRCGSRCLDTTAQRWCGRSCVGLVLRAYLKRTRTLGCLPPRSWPCRQALQTGLEASGSKRKQPEGGVGGGRPGARRGMLDSMLGELSSSEEEGDEEGG
jgi:hypothetical protein